jgi:hypothetical protein
MLPRSQIPQYCIPYRKMCEVVWVDGKPVILIMAILITPIQMVFNGGDIKDDNNNDYNNYLYYACVDHGVQPLDISVQWSLLV